MKLGAEPRKLIILGGLLAVAVVVLIYNSNSSDTPGGSTVGSVARTAGSAPIGIPLQRQHGKKRAVARTSERNTLRMKEVTVEAQQGEIDPTLRLDLLERLKGVKFTGGSRSLFEAGPAPMPAQLAAQKVTVMPGPLPQTPAQTANTPMPAPGPPPITLKFYGFAAPVNAGGTRQGFFLDEDTIFVADEGQIVKGRYRIISLQPKSAEVEDVVTKSRQTLPITPEMQSGF
jgi:hypothetical protein